MPDTNFANGSNNVLTTTDYADLVARALVEDVGDGDVTTQATVAPDVRAHGILLAKTPLIVAGLDVAAAVFTAVDPATTIEPQAVDGTECIPGTVIANVYGPARALLTGERVALNFLQRLSGIATTTRRYVAAASGRITILDTRKTTPMLRALEKYAVRVGGGRNHRFGLYDAFLIKDNHIRLAGGVAPAIARARAYRPTLPVEIEAQSLAQVDEALACGVDVLLVDNLPDADVREAVRRAKGHAKVEVSGGVTLERIPSLADTGADEVSIGALTHSAGAADISFEIEIFGAP